MPLENELLYRIFENLELERDINAFTQVNRHLYHLLNPYLYRHNIQQSGSSALLWAAQHGQEATAQKLLNEKADGQATSDYYRIPLYVAAEKGHKEIVKLLLNKGADVNAQGGEFGNALQAASIRGHEQIVKLLLDKGADVNAQGGEFGNALQAASEGGHEQIVKLPLDKDARYIIKLLTSIQSPLYHIQWLFLSNFPLKYPNTHFQQ